MPIIIQLILYAATFVHLIKQIYLRNLFKKGRFKLFFELKAWLSEYFLKKKKAKTRAIRNAEAEEEEEDGWMVRLDCIEWKVSPLHLLTFEMDWNTV